MPAERRGSVPRQSIPSNSKHRAEHGHAPDQTAVMGSQWNGSGQRLAQAPGHGNEYMRNDYMQLHPAGLQEWPMMNEVAGASNGAHFAPNTQPMNPVGQMRSVFVTRWNPMTPAPVMTHPGSYPGQALPPPVAAPSRARKPYERRSNVRETWTAVEHDRFLEGLKLHERDWKKIEDHIGTKTVIQIRSHAQKYFEKVQKNGLTDYVPPARPRKKREPKKEGEIGGMMAAAPGMPFVPAVGGVASYIPFGTHAVFPASATPGVCMHCQHHYHHAPHMADPRMHEPNNMMNSFEKEQARMDVDRSSGTPLLNRNTEHDHVNNKNGMEKAKRRESDEKKWFDQQGESKQDQNQKRMTVSNEDATMGSSNSDEGGSGANVNDGSSGNGLSSDENGDGSPEGKTSGGECDAEPTAAKRRNSSGKNVKTRRKNMSNEVSEQNVAGTSKQDDNGTGDNRSSQDDDARNQRDRSPSDPPSSDKKTVSSSRAYFGESRTSSPSDPSSSQKNNVEKSNFRDVSMQPLSSRKPTGESRARLGSSSGSGDGNGSRSGSGSRSPSGSGSDPNAGSGSGTDFSTPLPNKQNYLASNKSLTVSRKHKRERNSEGTHDGNGKSSEEVHDGKKRSRAQAKERLNVQKDEKRAPTGGKPPKRDTKSIDDSATEGSGSHDKVKSTSSDGEPKSKQSPQEVEDMYHHYIREVQHASLNADLAKVVCTAVTSIQDDAMRKAESKMHTK